MEEYKIAVNIEPKNKYEKAQKAVAEAIIAINDLTQPQQEQLMRECISKEALLNAYTMLKKYFG